MNRLPKSLEALTAAFNKLPGIGKKSALRLAMFIADRSSDVGTELVQSLEGVKNHLRTCQHCNNYSDQLICDICSDPRRDTSILCVVESIKDLIAIEDTGQFNGRYHVLGGLISPIDGIGPEELNFSNLFSRIDSEEIKEIILAISANIEGDTTMYYLTKQLEGKVSISSIARGVSFGGELDYADEFTLGRAIQSRLPVHKFFNGQ